jgi:hypothetical protein
VGTAYPALVLMSGSGGTCFSALEMLRIVLPISVCTATTPQPQGSRAAQMHEKSITRLYKRAVVGTCLLLRLLVLAGRPQGGGEGV